MNSVAHCIEAILLSLLTQHLIFTSALALGPVLSPVGSEYGLGSVQRRTGQVEQEGQNDQNLRQRKSGNLHIYMHAVMHPCSGNADVEPDWWRRVNRRCI